jgi:TatA/E family protein of Tat protein translocase
MIGSLGVPELIFILVLVLLVFGPKRLPEIGRTVGKGLAEFRKASNDLKRTINAELALEEETPRPEPPARIELENTAARAEVEALMASAGDIEPASPSLAVAPSDPVARDFAGPAAEPPVEAASAARPIEPS